MDTDPVMNNIFDLGTKKRFWSKVINIHAGECWIWNAWYNQNGYGIFWYNNKRERAHRISYIMHYGHIPENLMVCHKCDNERCVNPQHLFLGTNSDNQLDRYRKHPETAGGGSRSRFTNNEFDEMKSMRDKGMTIDYIGHTLGIPESTVSYTLKHFRRY